MTSKNRECVEEGLIIIVRNKPVLWDPSLPGYKSQSLKDGIWNEIANTLEIPAKDVEPMWRNLKDKFQFEVAKEQTEQSYVSRWPHYKRMLFLKRAPSTHSIVMTPREHTPVEASAENRRGEQQPIKADSSDCKTKKRVAEAAAPQQDLKKMGRPKIFDSRRMFPNSFVPHGVRPVRENTFGNHPNYAHPPDSPEEEDFLRSLSMFLRRVTGIRKSSFKQRVWELMEQVESEQLNINLA